MDTPLSRLVGVQQFELATSTPQRDEGATVYEVLVESPRKRCRRSIPSRELCPDDYWNAPFDQGYSKVGARSVPSRSRPAMKEG